MNIIQKTYKKAIIDGNAKRKDLAALKLDYYFNTQEHDLLAILEKQYRSTAKDILPLFVNIIKKTINLTSSVYVMDAQRIVTGTKQDEAIYSTFEDMASLPLVMKQCNRLTNLCGTTLLRPVFRRGRMEVDLLTPDILDINIGDSPNDIKTVMITHFSQNGRPDEVSYTLWTPESIYTLDYNYKEIRSEPNPYNTLPFVVVHHALPTNDFWLDGASNDLVSVQRAVNLHLSGLFHVLFYQGHATGFIKNGGDIASQDIIFGAGSMLTLPADGDVGFVAPDAPINERIESIKFLLEQSAIANGLPASVVTSQAREMSGVALTVENAELSESRRDQIAIFAKAEQELFNLFRIVWNVHNTNKMSDKATLKVDFAEPQTTMTPLERLNVYEREFNLGLTAPSDYICAKNPDFSRGEAIDYLTEVTAEIQRHDGSFPNYGLPTQPKLNTGI